MGKGTRTGRGKKGGEGMEQPTPEQMSAFSVENIVDKLPGGKQIVIGTAYRRKAMIDTLHDQGLFTTAEHKALRHYRHHADLADRSILPDSLGKRQGGGAGSGDGPTRTLLNAIRVRDGCERAAGTLADILRAVVVYDMSLSQWAMVRDGATEKCRDRKGVRVCAMEPRAKAVEIARMEIRMAAQRVQAELDADRPEFARKRA
ncbi:MAG TPA: hypothetical protein VD768_08665 [Sphingomicrobium sp.]|nr:hypothetical protein [Sphingomicrobium sp.]